jgi:uncharacterized protein
MNETDELTGNEYVSLPLVHADGGLDCVGVLHGGMAGLVEWWGPGDGTPLLRPRITYGGMAVSLEGTAWRRLDRWIPTCSVALADGSSIAVTTCAPPGFPAARGFFVRVDVENKGRRAVEVEFGLDVAWQRSLLRVTTERPMPGRNAMDTRNGVLTLAMDGGRGPALAITGRHAPDITIDAAMSPDADETLRATLVQRASATPQRRVSLGFYVGAGRERDGAHAAASGMLRTGADRLLRQARMELSHTLRAGHDHRWSDTLNRNLLFNRYYAVGRAIDDDRLYLLRSRSPRCPAPAVFNEREALLWTLPALVLADPGIAREALLRAFDMFSERSGEFSRYIDGGAFDGGFALDQMLLYPWIVDRYVQLTEDATVLDEPLVRQVIGETDSALYARLHPQHMLCGTELLPSGDAADHPYTTFANALLWAFCEALPRLWPANGNGNGSGPAPQFDGAATEVAAAIWQHLVTEVDGVPVFASSSSLEGDAAVYDDPLGSLVLLPFLGFCPADDPVWVSTMEFLRSRHYPLWREGHAAGLAARSDAGNARLAALCADLLGPGAEDALERLRAVRLPAALAAAAYDPATGEAAESDHAALAGFLAWSLAHAAEARSGTGSRKRPSP